MKQETDRPRRMSLKIQYNIISDIMSIGSTNFLRIFHILPFLPCAFSSESFQTSVIAVSYMITVFFHRYLIRVHLVLRIQFIREMNIRKRMIFTASTVAGIDSSSFLPKTWFASGWRSVPIPIRGETMSGPYDLLSRGIDVFTKYVFPFEYNQ